MTQDEVDSGRAGKAPGGKAPRGGVPAAGDVSRAEVQARIGDPTLVLVDVLPAASYAVGHIPGALSLPLAEVEARAQAIIPDRRADVVTYCASPSCTASREAAARLTALGYTRVRHYTGGLADWKEHGGPLEALKEAPGPAAGSHAAWRGAAARPRLHVRLLDWLGDRSILALLQIWFGLICGFGVIYWVAGGVAGHGLRAGGAPVMATWDGLFTSVYFSFVTALSIGYGDVIPTGFFRALAVTEGAAGLILFGAVISKLVSRRQEELTGEIHRIAFEARLGRVRTNLHLVLSELDAVAALCATPGAEPAGLRARVESAASVFDGELKAVHDLLYRPQAEPEEQVLASILATVASGLRKLTELLACMPEGARRSALLGANLRDMARLSKEICADCVPREHPASLDVWMDEIQTLARGIR